MEAGAAGRLRVGDERDELALVRVGPAELVAQLEHQREEVVARLGGRWADQLGGREVGAVREGLDEGVRHRAVQRHLAHVAGQGVGRAVEATEEGIATRGDAAVGPLRAAQPELVQLDLGADGGTEARGVRGEERCIVDTVE